MELEKREMAAVMVGVHKLGSFVVVLAKRRSCAGVDLERVIYSNSTAKWLAPFSTSFL